MDLHRVAVFVKVADEGGFTAAAKVLGLPKSSVSRSVALLEAELGARLLHRTTRSVTLTEAGATFYERASRGLLILDEAREAVVELESEIRGPVRITTAVDVGNWILAPVVQSFIEQHPAVQVEVALTARVVDLMEEGFDLGLRIGPIRDEQLIAKALPRHDFALYAAPAHLARHGTPKRVADLERHPCVLFRGRRGRSTWTLRGPSGEVSVDVSGPVSTDDFSFAVQLVAAGAGVSLLPAFVAERAEGLERVLPRHAMPGAPLHLLYPSGRYLPRRVAALRDHILAELTPEASKRRRSGSMHS